MKKGSLIVVLAIVIASCGGSSPSQNDSADTGTPFNMKETHPGDEKVRKVSDEALEFCKSSGYNTEFCFMVDMSMHSGFKRFFIWDLKKKRVIDTGLVSHGCGLKPWADDQTKDSPKFSNVPESHCSSYGKYEIGESGVCSWGINTYYLLHGLDKSNSKALEREIILHSWKLVPDESLYPAGTPEGWGCPAVSNAFMQKLDKLIKNSSRPVLLWVLK